jgi:hypothetical protein
MALLIAFSKTASLSLESIDVKLLIPWAGWLVEVCSVFALSVTSSISGSGAESAFFRCSINFSSKGVFPFSFNCSSEVLSNSSSSFWLIAGSKDRVFNL